MKLLLPGLVTWLLGGCGGSASSLPPGDAGATMDGGGTSAGDATSGMGPVMCSAMVCAAGSTCCLDFSGPTPVSCVAPGACGGLQLDCAGSSNCPSGQVCCGPGTTTGRAVCRSACQSGELEVCWDQATTCPAGSCCQQRFDVHYCIANPGC